MWTDYMGWTMDFTGPQMLLTLKLTTLAFDYNNSTKPVEVIMKFLTKTKNSVIDISTETRKIPARNVDH